VINFTGDPNWLPYEAFDEQGNYIGIVAEHLKLIEEKLGIKVEIIPTKTWSESVARVKRGEIDVLSETNDSDLTTELTFTQSYVSSPVVIIMKNKVGHVEDINQIKQKKIALIKDYGYVPQLRKQYSDIVFTEVNTIQDGLIAVSTGEVDVLLATLAQASYHISDLGVSNISIVGKTEFSTRLAFGMSQKFSPLVPLFNRALNEISKDQRRDILQRWVGDGSFGSAQTTIKLTEQEQQWISTHPNVRVGNEEDWPPYVFSVNGQPQGYSIDLIRLMAKKTGLKLEFVKGYAWDELLQKTKAGKIDVLPALWKTVEREHYLNYTDTYHTDTNVLILRKGSAFSLKDGFGGKVLAIVRGYAISESIKMQYPDVLLLEVDDVSQALLAVTLGKADAFIGSQDVTSYIIQDSLMTELQIADAINLKGQPRVGELRMATPKQSPVLASILQKGLDAISNNEKHQLQSRWIQDVNPLSSIKQQQPDFKVWLWSGIALSVLLIIILLTSEKTTP
jgi:ABC-type amino acid transport substrate-binding protein